MDLIPARVRAVRQEARDIRRIEIVAAQPLPEWSAGSHIDVHLPSGRVRQYSLCGDPRTREHYEIAVQLDAMSRGGAREVFALAAGDALPVSAPRNNFPLSPDARHHVLVAGGIGITPMVSMVAALERSGQSFELIYCTRSEERTAFVALARRLVGRGTAVLHHDEGQPERRFDFAGRLARRPAGAHLYCCGPAGLMGAVRDATASWPPETVHWEHFSNENAGPRSTDGSFRIRLASSGRTYDVPPDASILETLRRHGGTVESSCESGLCGTCKTRYLAGTPDHRDLILDDAEKQSYVMICCSRALSETLVLDL